MKEAMNENENAMIPYIVNNLTMILELTDQTVEEKPAMKWAKEIPNAYFKRDGMEEGNSNTLALDGEVDFGIYDEYPEVELLEGSSSTLYVEKESSSST